MKCISRNARAGLLRATLMLGVAMPAVAAMAPAASAQDYTNIAASGRVETETGKPIANATVTITSADRGITLSAKTNGSGAYSFTQIAPGTYDYSVTADGYETYQENGVVLSRQSGGGNSFRLISTANARNDIVVTGGRSRTSDFEDTTTGSVIDLADIDKRVPVARSLQDVLLLAPGVIRGNSGANRGFSDQIAISGASFIENAYFVNGLNITNFRMGLQPVEVPYDFYQTVEVKTGGFPAEYGRATGGVVNAVTKSGSNDYHFSVLGTWEPSGLRNTAPATPVIDNTNVDQSRRELVLQASGHIIKDRLFVYGLYDFRDFNSFTPNKDQDNATRVTNSSPFWGVKLDGYITSDQHLEFTYFDSVNDTHTRSFDYDRATGTLGDQVGGTNQRAGGKNYVGRYTGTFAPWLTVSAAYGVNKMRDGQLPLDTTNERVLDYRNSDSGVDIGLNRVTDAFGYNDDKREFYRGDVDLSFQLFGGHHVRFGYDHETDTSLQIHQTMGEGFYKIFTASADDAADLGITEGTDYYTTRVYANNGSSTVRNEAFYIEDNWSLFNDRLNLQLGLRNDRFSNQGVNDLTYFKSGDQWGPRLGASFDLFGDGRTKIYGSFGKYYLPVAGDLNLNLEGGLVTFTRYNLFNGLDATKHTPLAGDAILGPNLTACPDTGIANCAVAANGQPSDPSQAIAANLKSQSAREFIFGGEHRFADRIRAGFYFTHRELADALDDISIDLGARAYCVAHGFSQADCEKAYPGGRQYVIANPGRDVTVQLASLPDGSTPLVTLTAAQLGYDKPRRNYNALTFTFDRTYDGVWGVSASYTWAMDKGNYEGGVRSENGQLSIDRTADFDSPGFLNGAYGYLPNDRRHTFKLQGSYTPWRFLDLGTNILVQSPQHYSCIGTVPEEVDPLAHSYHGYSYYCNGKLIPRGTAFTGDWLGQVDVSAVVHVPMPRGLYGALRFDVFNVFDLQSVTSYNEFGQLSNDKPNSLYRTPVAYQEPRYVRVQFRLGF